MLTILGVFVFAFVVWGAMYLIGNRLVGGGRSEIFNSRNEGENRGYVHPFVTGAAMQCVDGENALVMMVESSDSAHVMRYVKKSPYATVERMGNNAFMVIDPISYDGLDFHQDGRRTRDDYDYSIAVQRARANGYNGTVQR